MFFPQPVAVTGCGAACALGVTFQECQERVRQVWSGLHPLGEMGDGVPEGLAGLAAGWIPDRAYLKGRRYGAASNAAVLAAREAMAGAGWGAAEAGEAWLWVGTSRGNGGELVGALEVAAAGAEIRGQQFDAQRGGVG